MTGTRLLILYINNLFQKPDFCVFPEILIGSQLTNERYVLLDVSILMLELSETVAGKFLISYHVT